MLSVFRFTFWTESFNFHYNNLSRNAKKSKTCKIFNETLNSSTVNQIRVQRFINRVIRNKQSRKKQISNSRSNNSTLISKLNLNQAYRRIDDTINILRNEYDLHCF